MQEVMTSPGLQKWMRFSLVVAVIGLCLSIYASLHHFELLSAGSTDSFCNINDQFSCDDVAKSAYSMVFKVPLGVWGVGFFLAQIVLIFMMMFKRETMVEHAHAQAGLVVIGAITSIILAIISKVAIGKFCVNCIGIYALCLIQLGILWTYRKELPKGLTLNSIGNGGLTAAIVVAVVVGLFKFQRDSFITPHSTTQAPKSENSLTSLDLAPNAIDIKLDKSPYSGLGEDFRKGNDNARVVIVEFADFQCPACRSAWDLMKQVQQQYGDQVLIVYKNYPLDKTCNSSVQQQIHQYACEAATLVRCAGMQGKFWELANKMYENQPTMNSENMASWALSVGLSPQQISACKASKDIPAKIADDIKQGNQLNVSSTPTIYINGRQILGGRSVETIQAEIQRILGS